MAKKSNSNKLVVSIIVMALGILTILPLFISQFIGIEAPKLVSGTSITYYELFDDRWADLFKLKAFKGEGLISLIKISTIVAVVAGIVLAVLSLLKLLGVSFGLLNLLYKIAAFVAIVAGIIVLVATIIFFVTNASYFKDSSLTKNVKIFGGWVWYAGFIAPIGAGAIAFKNV